MNKATKRKMNALDNLETRIKVELQQENEELKEEVQQHIKWNEAHTKRIIELSEENKKLKEVLRKCEPFVNYDEKFGRFKCDFCGAENMISGKHADDCEYIKLCGETE